MAPVFSRLSDSLVSDWTGVDSKIYNRPSLLIGALPPSPEDDSWLNFTDRAWFAPCLGEDWVRLAFLFPASAAAAGARLPTHTCGVVLRSIQECIPTYAELEGVVLPNKLSPDLWQILRLHFTTPAVDNLDAESFWKFAARYLKVFVFPRFRGGHRDFPEERGGVLRVHHLRHLGFGVSSIFALKHGDPIEGLWGRLFELTPEDSTSLESLDTSTRKTKVSGDNSSVEFILLGPLGLANHSCSEHSTIAPDQDELRRPLDPGRGSA